MGAKQSKRSVDISGKEAESAGEVAAAGAGGEGRVEPLADADALKPQLNGDAHIHEPSDKEKQLDSGTPENEKDATTEKEGKEQEAEKDKESTPVANGDSEQPQQGEATETALSPDESKKPKKEKLKKKWSLRSISFSRKDKPKQEKKQKEEEAKTNGEPEKVPEEVTESSPETETKETPVEKVETETKDEKTPETPVTEPITNGISTPETPKEETITVDENTAAMEIDRTEPPKAEVEPEQLPVNGLSVEQSKNETSEPAESETSKPEEVTLEKPEPVPATEIPVKNEVCVEKMPLIEPTPPPLPANPPPSSVVSFAATTMAPELTDASLANTADLTSNTTPIDDPTPKTETVPAVEKSSELSPHDTQPKIVVMAPEPTDSTESNADVNIPESSDLALSDNVKQEVCSKETQPCDDISDAIPNTVTSDNADLENLINDDEHSRDKEIDSTETEVVNDVVNDTTDDTKIQSEAHEKEASPERQEAENETADIPSPETTLLMNETILEKNTEVVPAVESVERTTDTENENLKNKSKDISEKMENVECNGKLDEGKLANGDVTPEAEDRTYEQDDSAPPSLAEALRGDDAFPPPPADLAAPPAPAQELPTTPDKIADLIPEVPTVPELKTEMETTTDVAVAN